MDQGIAILCAGLMGGIFGVVGALLGSWLESGRATARASADRRFQTEQAKLAADLEDARSQRRVEIEERHAQENRIREFYLEQVRDTQGYLVSRSVRLGSSAVRSYDSVHAEPPSASIGHQRV
jgi:hypothetical protein